MCKCNPSVRTPFCGKLNCEWPGSKPEGARDSTPKGTGAGEVRRFVVRSVCNDLTDEVELVRASDFDSYRERAEARIAELEQHNGLYREIERDCELLKAERDAALARAEAAEKVLRDADELIEDWIGLLLANHLRHSVIDGETVRAQIAALAANAVSAKGEQP